jgi:hypothetical protein
MLETRKEVRTALMEINGLTDWSMREVARKAKIDVATVSRLFAFPVGNLPYPKTRKNIFKLLTRVRSKYGKENTAKARHGDG